MSQLTFDGMLPNKGGMRYKGGLCAEYVVKADSASGVFKFAHGDRVKLRKGPHASRGPLVVVGTTLSADTDTHSLVLHDEFEGAAFVLANCKDFSELSARHEPEAVSAFDAVGSSIAEVTGELGHRYSVNTDTTVLDSAFGLTAGSKVFFKSIDGVATVAGVFLNVLWVEPAGLSRAVPLVGGNSEAALLSLHGMRDADTNTGATSPRTPRTPGRTRQAPAYMTDLGRGVAVCTAAYGAKVEVLIDAASLKPFGVKHAQRLVASRGVDNGKTFTVVGVKSGSLYVHIEGDRRVTTCRNCPDAEAVDTMYGFGLGVAKSRSASPLGSTAATAGSSSRSASPTTLASPRSVPGAVPKPVWTAHGRVHFDTSAAGCAAFGYKHGQTLEATKGGDRGAVFHVVGVRHGTLWAVPDGSSRATAFRHCSSKADLDKRYGFRVVGTTVMDRYTTANDEPGKTPMNSPRRSGRNDATPSAPLNFSTPTPVRDPYAAQQQQQQPASRPAVVPQLPLGQLARSAAQDKALGGPTYTVAPDTSSTSIPDVGPSASVDRSVEPTPFVPGQMPATRIYLKAFAHFKLGHNNAGADPFAFHGYYSRDPQKNLAEAMACLPTFSQHWRQALANKCSVAFGHATEEEMLDAMRASAHLLN